VADNQKREDKLKKDHDLKLNSCESKHKFNMNSYVVAVRAKEKEYIAEVASLSKVQNE